MIRFRWLVFFVFCWPNFADDTRLNDLRAALLGTRQKGNDSGGAPRGATPQLTGAKHQLRNWVESRLTALSLRADERDFAGKLNSELRAADLFCGEDAGNQKPCPEWTLLGFLNPLRIQRTRGFLIVQTGVGIECGFDESAYLYSWSKEGWRRVWQTEQNTYIEKAYRPQTIHEVLVSPYSKTNNYVVLTLGSESWCMSYLHNVYYRAFRLGPDPDAQPLVEGAEWARIDGDPPIHGSVTVDDVLVEFTIMGGLDGDAHGVVRHYRIDHNNVKRIDPFALTPRDFVNEWVTHDWKETAFWSESANRRSMREWHEKLHKPGEFIYPTMHCPTTPDLWQVGVDFSNPPTPIGKEPKGTYFLVRWRPPYVYTMAEVRDRPAPACTEEDRRADDEHRTLFPAQ